LRPIGPSVGPGGNLFKVGLGPVLLCWIARDRPARPDFGPTLDRLCSQLGCSMTYSLLDAKMSAVRLLIVDSTWQSTLALTLAGCHRCSGGLNVAGFRHCRGSLIQGGSHRCRESTLHFRRRLSMIVDCSLTHSQLDAKMSAVRLLIVSLTWQSTLALTLASCRRCRGM
jgi:hypothetical protein